MRDREDDPGAERRTERFAAALVELDRELDWSALGRAYCWSGGDDFFAPPDRAALRDAGLAFAADVGDALAALDGARRAAGPGRSLYLGAALAELAPMLFERLVLDREVVAVSLAGAETAELGRALAAVGARLGVELVAIGTDGIPARCRGTCDHLWMVSVLTDPEAFPALHDRLYGREGGPDAVGGGELEEELGRARDLLDGLLGCARRPALLTTTDEERELLADRGLALSVPPTARLSPVVGDPVRVCRLD